MSRINSAMSRVALLLATSSAIFWFTSWPPIPMGDDFPNRVSARLDTSFFAVGCLSHYGSSTLFGTTDGIESGRAVWSEEIDGHFCNFHVPTSSYGVPTGGFCVVLSLSTIGWDCPYWLMTALWTVVLFKTRKAFRFDIRDLLLVTTLVAITITAIRLRVALPIVVSLNLATAALCLLLLVGAVRAFINAHNPWWPIVVERGPTDDFSDQ